MVCIARWNVDINTHHECDVCWASMSGNVPDQGRSRHADLCHILAIIAKINKLGKYMYNEIRYSQKQTRASLNTFSSRTNDDGECWRTFYISTTVRQHMNLHNFTRICLFLPSIALLTTHIYFQQLVITCTRTYIIFLQVNTAKHLQICHTLSSET
jgi:hypothetical protein